MLCTKGWSRSAFLGADRIRIWEIPWAPDVTGRKEREGAVVGRAAWRLDLCCTLDHDFMSG